MLLDLFQIDGPITYWTFCRLRALTAGTHALWLCLQKKSRSNLDPSVDSWMKLELYENFINYRQFPSLVKCPNLSGIVEKYKILIIFSRAAFCLFIDTDMTATNNACKK